MSVLVCLLLVGPALAFRHGGNEQHNLFEREEPDTPLGVVVECPTCRKTTPYYSEECLTDRHNNSYKICKLGTYYNELCGNRLDCYRGAGERCSVYDKFDKYDQRCTLGYHCSGANDLCIGEEYNLDIKYAWIDPEDRVGNWRRSVKYTPKIFNVHNKN